MADFLTVNLNSILKNQRSFADMHSAEQKNETPAPAVQQERDLSGITDWASELKTRLAENRTLESGTRQSDYEVEAQFFEDYFNNANKLWDEACAKQLISLGEPLKKALKVLGFNRRTNPILGFITSSYVITKLLKTDLLNVNTFKAIYNAVSKRLVVSSEFMKPNDYNIIYCQDLYHRSPTEMEKYLALQSKILTISADTYTAEIIEKNKKVFFYIKAIAKQGDIKVMPAGSSLPSAKGSSTKLNSIDFATKLADINAGRGKSGTANNNTASAGINALARKISSNPASALAAIYYLSTTTDTPEAKAALAHEAFKTVSTDALLTTSSSVTELMRKTEMSATETKAFISLVLNNLESA